MVATTHATFQPMASFPVILQPIVPTWRLEPLEYSAIRRRALPVATLRRSSSDHSALGAVRRVVLTARQSLPVYPDKQTISEPIGTSRANFVRAHRISSSAKIPSRSNQRTE